MIRIIGVLLMLSSGVVYWYASSPAPPDPAPVPAVTIPAELTASLASLDVPARDKQIWGGLLAGLGRFILADGASKSPVLKTVADLERLRDAAVRAPIEPVAGGDKLGPVLATYLKQLGGPAEPLDQGRRESAANLFVGAGKVLADDK